MLGSDGGIKVGQQNIAHGCSCGATQGVASPIGQPWAERGGTSCVTDKNRDELCIANENKEAEKGRDPKRQRDALAHSGRDSPDFFGIESLGSDTSDETPGVGPALAGTTQDAKNRPNKGTDGALTAKFGAHEARNEWYRAARHMPKRKKRRSNPAIPTRFCTRLRFLKIKLKKRRSAVLPVGPGHAQDVVGTDGKLSSWCASQRGGSKTYAYHLSTSSQHVHTRSGHQSAANSDSACHFSSEDTGSEPPLTPRGRGPEPGQELASGCCKRSCGHWGCLGWSEQFFTHPWCLQLGGFMYSPACTERGHALSGGHL